MAPKNKAKAAGVSASSFFDLRAELAKQEEQFAKNKAAGKSTALAGGVKRPDRKPTVWARQNAGVQARAARDVAAREEAARPDLDALRAKLERKVEVYEQLRSGKSGGLSEKQYDALLVDFEQKPIDAYASDSDDVDESLTVPRAPGGEEDDPLIEYEDEFGRARTARQSEIPRHLLPQEEKEEDIDPFVIYNPVNHFPTYEPSAERVADVRAQLAEAASPLDVHYDAAREVRAKGAGFYQFSADEETRRRQMDALRAARAETGRAREARGAVDVLPGATEGMRAGEEEDAGDADARAGAGGLGRSRAMEKRKRELEARRRVLDAKRRKVGGGARQEREGPHAEEAQETPSAPVAPAPANPFAAVEAQSAGWIGKPDARPVDPADAFLAQLERDILLKTKT